MRLGPFELRRKQVLAAADPVKRPPSELGASGTVNVSGFLQSSEYVQNLSGLAGLAVFDQMLRSDGSVQEAIEHILSPVKNATWEIEPASDDPEHLEQAAFVRCAYFKHLRRPWIESLDEQLDYLLYGFAVFETVFQIQEEALYFDDPETGDEVELPSRQFVTLASLEPRLQSTIYKWNVDRGDLASVTQ